MQTAPPPPHSLTEILWYVLAAFLAGGGVFKAVTLWLTRRQPDAVVHETDARTARLRAETRQIDAQTNASAGDILLRMMDRMATAQISFEQMRSELEEWKTKAEKVPILEAENKILFEQLEQMKAQKLLSD